MLNGLWTEADGTAMTTEHYGTGAAHYDHSLLATTQLFPTGCFHAGHLNPESNSELEAAVAGYLRLKFWEQTLD